MYTVYIQERFCSLVQYTNFSKYQKKEFTLLESGYSVMSSVDIGHSSHADENTMLSQNVGH